MRLRNIKRNLLCFALIFCMLAGDLLQVIATESGEPAVNQSTEQEAAPTEEKEPETSEDVSGETPPETPEEMPEVTPEETPGGTPTVPPEETPTETPEEETETPGAEDADPAEEAGNVKTETGESLTEEKTPEETEEETVEEETEEEIEETSEEFFDFGIDDAGITTMSLDSLNAMAVNDSSTLENITKKIRKNNNGTYTLELTVKAPEVTTKQDILFVMDLSASMRKYNRIDQATKLVLNVQKALENNTSTDSRMGIIGFYNWAGQYIRTAGSLNTDDAGSVAKTHGYENPLYLTFDEWENQKISYGRRTESTGKDGTLCDLSSRSVIPDLESLYTSTDGKDLEDNGSNALFYNTNWEAAFFAARDMLASTYGQDDRETMLVFITDGEPTAYMNTSQLRTGKVVTPSADDRQTCAENLKRFFTINDTNNTYFTKGYHINELADKIISVKLGVEDGTEEDSFWNNMGYTVCGREMRTAIKNNWLSGTDEKLSNASKTRMFYEIPDDDNTEAIYNEILREILKDYYSNAVITDTLTSKFEFANTTAKMTITESGSTTAATFTPASCVINGKTITVGFGEDYYLVPGATYTLSFDIKPTQEAYDTFANNCGSSATVDKASIYPDTGDADTDLDSSNIISSKKKGYYTNTKATVTAWKNGTEESHEYLKPVAQIDLVDIPVTKKWVTSATSHSPVTVGLYQDGKTTAYRTYTFPTANATTQTGTFYNVPPGHTYTVKETTSLTNYQVTYSPESYLSSASATELKKGFTVTNTQLIPITVEKVWKVADSSLKPSDKILEVGIGKSPNTKTNDIVVELKPISTGSNTWRGTAYIPYESKTTTLYYFKEYWDESADVTTTCNRVKNDGEMIEVNILSGNSSQFRSTQGISIKNLLETEKITFINTQMFEIEVEKQWSVKDAEIPESLTIGVGSSASSDVSSDYVSVILQPKNTGDTVWTGTIKVPYEANGQYYFKEYFNDTRFYTSHTRTLSNGRTTNGEVLSDTTSQCRYFSSNANGLKNLKKVTFKNAQLIDIPVEKRWNIITPSLLPENEQLIVQIVNGDPAFGGQYVETTLTPDPADKNLWTGTIEDMPCFTDTQYYVREMWNPESPPTTETVMECIPENSTERISLGTVTAGSGYRQATISGADLVTSEKLLITNTEKISLTIEKKWVLPEGDDPGTAVIKVQALGESNKLRAEYTYTLTEIQPSMTQEIPYDPEVISYKISEPDHTGYAVSYEVIRTGSTSEGAKEGNEFLLLASGISEVEKVVFTNTRENEITVEKVWIGGNEDSLTVSLAPTGNLSSPDSTVTLNAENDWTGKLKVKYDTGINSYKIWETLSNAGEYNSTVKIGEKSYSGTAKDSLTYTELIRAGTIVFTNERKTGSLVVTKEVRGTYAASGEAFDITITLLDKNGNASDYSGTTIYDSPEKEVTFKNGVATVSLKNGESVCIPEIPLGYQYKVTETSYDNYETAYQVNEKDVDTASGTVSESSPEEKVTVINTEKDIVTTGIFTDYGSYLTLLAVAFLGAGFYIALIYKKKKTK